MAAITPRVVLYTAKHDPTTIVDRCAVVSALGWGDGASRERLGIETPGPELCITPAGVFDFPPPTRSMRVLHIRPGWTVERLAAATGFDLLGLADATEVPPPTPIEVQVLRERIDIDGALRATDAASTVRR
jgi:glutaconate CoA-transferase subunit B